MPCVAYVVANPPIRKCGNFGAFRVSGCSSRNVWPPRGTFGATFPPGFFSVAKGLLLL